MNTSRCKDLRNQGQGSALPRCDFSQGFLLQDVEQGLADGIEILRWWRNIGERNRYAQIPVIRDEDSPQRNFGLLGEVPLRRGLLPVIGLAQEILFYRPKSAEDFSPARADWYRSQVREFMLKWFMRVAATRRMRYALDLRTTEPKGWGYSQLLYKLKESGRIGRFSEEERSRIVDLREIGEKYEWIIVRVRIFDFKFERPLLGAMGPRLDIPVHEEVLTVISRDLVVDRDGPEPGVLGEYGFATAVVPTSNPDSILAYGPKSLITACQVISFRVMEDGTIWARTAFVGGRPTALLRLNPVDLGFGLADLLSLGLASRLLAPLRAALSQIPFPRADPIFTFANLANSITGGLAERNFSISTTRIIRDVMAKHAQELHHLIGRIMPIWSEVSDWLDPPDLIDWLDDLSRSTLSLERKNPEHG